MESRFPGVDEVAGFLHGVDRATDEAARSDLFFRHLAQHLARDAAADFHRSRTGPVLDGAAAVGDFLRHEEAAGRLARGEIVAAGRGFRFGAEVHQCRFAGSCKSNLAAVGEVPQCVRAVTLIEAVNARISARPPLTYDLAPGLVDGTHESCSIRVRPAGVPEVDSALGGGH